MLRIYVKQKNSSGKFPYLHDGDDIKLNVIKLLIDKCQITVKKRRL